MAEIISFRQPGKRCETCTHYIPSVMHPSHSFPIIDGPPSRYCKHPDRTKGYYLTDNIITELDLHRGPDEWCPKYERIM